MAPLRAVGIELQNPATTARIMASLVESPLRIVLEAICQPVIVKRSLNQYPAKDQPVQVRCSGGTGS